MIFYLVTLDDKVLLYCLRPPILFIDLLLARTSSFKA